MLLQNKHCPLWIEIVFMQNKIFKAKPGLQQTNNTDKEKSQCCRGFLIRAAGMYEDVGAGFTGGFYHNWAD